MEKGIDPWWITRCQCNVGRLVGKETDSGGSGTPPPVSTKVVEPSGPTPFDTEEEMTTEGPTDPDSEMKTVEIL